MRSTYRERRADAAFGWFRCGGRDRGHFGWLFTRVAPGFSFGLKACSVGVNESTAAVTH